MADKMYDLGEKSGGVETLAAPMKEKSKHYPTLYLDADQLPHLDDYDVGDEVALSFKAVVIRKNESDGPEGKRCSIDLELRKGHCVAM